MVGMLRTIAQCRMVMMFRYTYAIYVCTSMYKWFNSSYKERYKSPTYINKVSDMI